MLTQKEVWYRLRKRPYLISFLQSKGILFKAIPVLMKYPTDGFKKDYLNPISEHLRIDSIFRYTWSFDKAEHLKGWELMKEWPEYYKSKNEL